MKNTTLRVVFITSWFCASCNNVAEFGADAFIPGKHKAESDAFVLWAPAPVAAGAAVDAAVAPSDAAVTSSASESEETATGDKAEETAEAGERSLPGDVLPSPDDLASETALNETVAVNDAGNVEPDTTDLPEMSSPEDVLVLAGPPEDPCVILGCPKDTACMKWKCDLEAQKCKAFVPVDEACDDGDSCTADDTCTPMATCVGALPPETCGDGVDNDCDGEIDETCPNTLLIEPMILMLEPVEDEAMCGAELYTLSCDPPGCDPSAVTPQDVLATNPSPYQTFDPKYPLPQLVAFTISASLPLYLDVRYEEGRVDHQCFNVFYTFSENSWNKEFRVTIQESGVVLWAETLLAADGAVIWIVNAN